MTDRSANANETPLARPCQPELLAPAGDDEALRAAVANGADAVYFGLSHFNARHRATNFALENLPAVMEFLHDRNVRGYVALNTLIFSDELETVSQVIEGCVAGGVDAVIVQDLGLVGLIRELAPDLPIHASTQMTLTEPAGIEWVRSLGVDRVILARELSLAEIERIAAQSPMPVEVFVHGALCVAYSGQCLTSEALGGRSANRGQCAQACRMPYEMIVDGRRQDLGDRAYLLSPQDLAAPDLIRRLVGLGVCSFKIEGRLKSAAYVAGTTQTYRAALDAALADRSFELSQQELNDLAQTFSRGLTHGFLDGPNHQDLVQGRFPKSRGVKIGQVVAKNDHGIIVASSEQDPLVTVKPGDGVVFDEGHPEQDEQGGRVYALEPMAGGPAGEKFRGKLIFGRGTINLAAVPIGSIVWKTDDPVLRRRLERSYSNDRPPRRVAIDVDLAGQPGEALSVVVRSADGGIAEVTWPGPLERSQRHPLSPELVQEQFCRLGDTPFQLGKITLRMEIPVLVPKSVLNALRRQAVAQLLQQRRTIRQARRIRPEALRALREKVQRPSSGEPSAGPASRLYVLVRSLEQLEAVLAWQPNPPLDRPALVYCDFEDLRRYPEAVARGQAAGLPIGLATLRICKPQETGLLRQIATCHPHALLVRNLAGLVHFRQWVPEIPLVGDFSLNIANELTADRFAREGLMRLVPSYDLNWEQLAAMVRRSDPGLFEVVIHQHMPMFHMEHCVFAAFLSTGKDWRDCGRPCDRHRVELRDQTGMEFPVAADTGCRNTVYNAVPQSAAEYVRRMQALGLRHFRIECLREDAGEVTALLEHYGRVLAGLEDGRQSWRRLRALNQLGVTRGTLQLV